MHVCWWRAAKLGRSSARAPLAAPWPRRVADTPQDSDDEVSAHARRYSTLWIFDLHLGTPGCQAEALLGFLKRTEYQTLYLVSDTAGLRPVTKLPQNLHKLCG